MLKKLAIVLLLSTIAATASADDLLLEKNSQVHFNANFDESWALQQNQQNPWQAYVDYADICRRIWMPGLWESFTRFQNELGNAELKEGIALYMWQHYWMEYVAIGEEIDALNAAGQVAPTSLYLELATAQVNMNDAWDKYNRWDNIVYWIEGLAPVINGVIYL